MGRAAALFAWCALQPTGASSPHLQMGRAPAPQHPKLGCVPLGAERRVRGAETCSVLRINVTTIPERPSCVCLSLWG